MAQTDEMEKDLVDEFFDPIFNAQSETDIRQFLPAGPKGRAALFRSTNHATRGLIPTLTWVRLMPRSEWPER